MYRRWPGPRFLLACMACLAALCAACSSLALEVNQATAAELDSIRGIGPGLSTPMLAERAKAPFKNWQDLIARVRGMGPANAARFSAQGLTVEGAPYERPSPPARGDTR